MSKFIKFVFSFQFSKILMILETILVGYLCYNGIALAKLCILNGFDGSLSWVTGMIGGAYTAYGVSASFYYNKSKAEQIKKIEVTGSEYSAETGECEYTLQQDNYNDTSVPSI